MSDEQQIAALRKKIRRANRASMCLNITGLLLTLACGAEITSGLIRFSLFLQLALLVGVLLVGGAIKELWAVRRRDDIGSRLARFPLVQQREVLMRIRFENGSTLAALKSGVPQKPSEVAPGTRPNARGDEASAANR